MRINKGIDDRIQFSTEVWKTRPSKKEINKILRSSSEKTRLQSEIETDNLIQIRNELQMHSKTDNRLLIDTKS